VARRWVQAVFTYMGMAEVEPDAAAAIRGDATAAVCGCGLDERRRGLGASEQSAEPEPRRGQQQAGVGGPLMPSASLRDPLDAHERDHVPPIAMHSLWVDPSFPPPLRGGAGLVAEVGAAGAGGGSGMAGGNAGGCSEAAAAREAGLQPPAGWEAIWRLAESRECGEGAAGGGSRANPTSAAMARFVVACPSIFHCAPSFTMRGCKYLWAVVDAEVQPCSTSVSELLHE
jgi:hypothetical protein